MLHLTKSFLPGALALCMLAACGGGETADPNAGTETLPNGMTVRAQIEARQDGFEAIGGNFKTISDELKSDAADIEAIQAAAADLPEVTAGMADWFPEGTGPESGVETEALPIIWEEPDDFADKMADFQAAVAALDTTAQSGDLDAISAVFRTTGGTCKACHDKFRLDD